MEPDEPETKDYNFEVPVVASRREFFDQESIFVDEPNDDAPDFPAPEDPVEDLKRMREEAAKRTRTEDG